MSQSNNFNGNDLMVLFNLGWSRLINELSLTLISLSFLRVVFFLGDWKITLHGDWKITLSLQSCMLPSTKLTKQIFFLTILSGKNCFIQFSIRMAGRLLLTIFICLPNQFSSNIHSIIM